MILVVRQPRQLPMLPNKKGVTGLLLASEVEDDSP